MKVTTKLKEKLHRIRTELEDELIREKIVTDECDGVELNALDEGGVMLLFQDPEYCEEVEDVENYENLDVSLEIYFAKWLPEAKVDSLKQRLREKLTENKIIFSAITGDGGGCYIYGASVEGEGGAELHTLFRFLDFLKTAHRLNSKTAAVNRAAEIIGVTPMTIWRWLDSKPAPTDSMNLLMNLIMERGSTKNLPH